VSATPADAAGLGPATDAPVRQGEPWNWAIALFGGAVFGSGFNLVLLPAPAGWLAPVMVMAGIGLILRSLRGTGAPGRGALLGLLGHLGAGAVGLFWMRCITFPAYLGVALYIALYGAGFGALLVLARRRTPGWAHPLLAAGLWTALEWVRSWAFTGFPWMLAGSVWADLPLAMGPADLGGVHLVSFLTALMPAMLVAERPKRRLVRGITAAGIALLVLGYSALGILGVAAAQSPSTGENRCSPLRVAAVQPLVPFKVGPKANRERMLADQLELCQGLEPGTIDLLIMSETMIPGDLNEQVEPTLAPLAREKRCCLLAGGVIHEGRDADGAWAGRSWNSALLVSPAGAVLGRYDKRHLVPFGEYVPFGGRFPGADYVFHLIGTIFTPGEAHPLIVAEDRVGTASLPGQAGTTVLVGYSVPLAVNICYEDCFPYIARRDARRGARLMVNLTNDSWFRQSSEARQHLALAAFRAVETRTPLVRATNTGITALINADGAITAPPEGGLWRKGLVRMDAPVGRGRPTVYASVGDVFVWLCAAAAVGAALAGLRRSTPKTPG